MNDRNSNENSNLVRNIEHYREAFGKRTDAARRGWLAPIQEQAIAAFAELGFPSRRLEAWRETNVAPIAKQAFRPAAQADAADLGGLELPDLGGSRLVFVDGHFAADASHLEPDAALEFLSLAEASQHGPPAQGSALSHFATLVHSKDDGFSALNTAFATDGALITLKRGRALSAPLQLVFVSCTASPGEGQPGVSFPRVLIVAEGGSEGVVVQDHVSLGSGVALSCSVCEVITETDASLKMVLVQRESDSAFHIARQRVRQQRDSSFSLHTLSLGGAILRNDLGIDLADEGAECNLGGLYLGKGRQHVDNHTEVEHSMPYCSSHELYKGVLGGRSRGVFRGRVIVRPGGQRTEAVQQNGNLLLSRHAEADTQPQLEIYADDVKCSHGSSIGQLDEDALFFLRSRGLGEHAARALLTTGFTAQVTDSIADERIRDWAKAVANARLDDLFAAGQPS